MTNHTSWPTLGCGVGLRTQHYQAAASENPRVDWFEAVTENFMDSGGRPVRVLEEVRRRYPVALHGVALSIGSADALDARYLDRLEALVKRIDPAIVSDHVSWSGTDGETLHDLLPLPFTEESVAHVVRKTQQVQERLKRQIVLENVSTYVTYKHSTMAEWDFISEIARRSGCGILLDLNNIYVNSKNHGFDPFEYMRKIPASSVAQFHLAGHTDMGKFLFDTHGGEVVEAVWDLYREALGLFGPVSTLIEWDEAVPELPRLLEEADKARKIQSEPAAWRKNPPTGTPSSPPARARSKISLSETQRAMQTAIRPDQGSSESLAPLLNKQGGDAGVERMSVYSGGYLARIKDALADVYEGVKHVLGEAVFSNLAADYARAHRSLDYNLNHAGERFPEFIESSSWAERFTFLPDLARLERASAAAFHAFEPDVFDATPLTGVSPDEWGELVFELQPSVSLIASQWPIRDIWLARKKPLNELDIDLENLPQNVLLWRQGLEIHSEVVNAAGWTFLTALAEGRTLEDSCEGLPDDAVVGDWIAGWSSRGVFRRVGLRRDVTPLGSSSC